jgi:hypothetical protein
VVGEDEQRSSIGTPEQDLNRSLWHVDAADRFAGRVVDEDW